LLSPEFPLPRSPRQGAQSEKAGSVPDASFYGYLLQFISIFGQTAAIDAHVGARIREFRTMLGLTQRQLGEMIGISDRQVHKYGARAQPGVGEFGV